MVKSPVILQALTCIYRKMICLSYYEFFQKVSWINQIHLVKVSNGLQSKIQTKDDGKIKPKGKSFPLPTLKVSTLMLTPKKIRGKNGFNSYISKDVYYIYTYLEKRHKQVIVYFGQYAFSIYNSYSILQNEHISLKCGV